MFRVGVHERGGPIKALQSAHEREYATAMQIFQKGKLSYHFTRSFRQEMEQYASMCEAANIEVVVHASYIINLVSVKPHICKISLASLIEEMDAAQYMGAKYIVMHPGAVSKDHDLELAYQELYAALRSVLVGGGWKIKLLLETMPGGKNKTQLGYYLDNLAFMIQKLKQDGANVGACFDSCHVFAAGYDFHSSLSNFTRFWEQWLEYFGEVPEVLHINGAAKEFGHRKDGHATLNGQFNSAGNQVDCQMNPEVFKWLKGAPALQNSIHILETPIMYHEADLKAYLTGDPGWKV